MPFELGLAVAWAQLNPKKHTWIGCERHPYRPLKSVSDLNGTDFHIHGGTIQGVMRELCNAFVRTTKRPSVPRMVKVYQQLRVTVPDLKREAGARDLFQARVFDDLVVAAGALAEEYL